ncbi:DnaJ domain-containing protein [Halteromyces radiatus]|uniref:DnaJ domain-containing protein n=1 Tax=Halteromyces radiatus TaxID=101107 RepID=UPI00221F094E|nr:DnaJ domain-containing protein [Halteromyces radiatus]KAI8092629.1 DnaJ domain-containing protein [Halteromyces radiatus]
MKKEDPYKILGISKSASQNDIKKAYYALAKKYHPDTNKEKNAREKFTQVQEAYEMLSDEQKRAQFDQYGYGFEGGPSTAGGPGPGFGPGGFYSQTSSQGFPGGFDPNDIFNQFFGGASHYQQAAGMGEGFRTMTGENLQTPLTITFMEAVKGTKKTVHIQQVTNCSSCKGNGMKQGIKKETCKVCHGSGVQTVQMGGFNMQTTCSVCGGAGAAIPLGGECSTCQGIGKIRERKAVQVEIPPGVDNKARIRVVGQGDAPLKGNGPHGDLFVSLNIQPSKIFSRQDQDIFLNTKIPFYKAILGGKIRIPTIDGDVELKIPKGSQADDKIALRGRGIQHMRGTGRGDQVVTLKVELPRILRDDQRTLIEKYAQLVDPEYRDRSK